MVQPWRARGGAASRQAPVPRPCDHPCRHRIALTPCKATMRRPRMPERERGGDGPIAFEPHQLSGLFSAPRWLRDLGLSAWLAVGVALFLVALIWILTLTHTIVAPLITAGVVAAVAAPLVAWLQRHGVPRLLGAALVLLGALALAV